MLDEINEEAQQIIEAARQCTEGRLCAVGVVVETEFDAADFCDTSMLSQGKDHAQALKDAAFIEAVQPVRIVSLLQRMQEIIYMQCNALDSIRAASEFSADEAADLLEEIGHQMPDNVIQQVSITTMPKPTHPN